MASDRSAVGVRCTECGMYVHYMKRDLDGLHQWIDIRAAAPRQIVEALLQKKPVFKKIALTELSCRYVWMNPTLLARWLTGGGNIKELDYTIHLEHPHRMTAQALMAPRAQARTLAPAGPPQF